MYKSTIAFFLIVLCLVIVIARHNSRRISQNAGVAAVASSAAPTPVKSTILVPPPSASPVITSASPAPVAANTPVASDFQKIADRVAPAVILISVFDSSGKLLRNGTGFFVSEDGRLVTSWSVVDGGANAVAKTSDGQIYNVLGILAEAAPTDIAVLKAQVKQHVPFLSPNKAAAAAPGTQIAAIGSSLSHHEQAISQASVASRRSDANSEWLELSTPIPGESLGAPVVNEKGDILGLVALQRGQGPAVNVVRMTTSLETIFAKIEPRTKPAWLAAGGSPTPPADGPLQKPKIPLAGAHPSGNSRLIFSPVPQYPTAARHSLFPIKGTGRYRVQFRSNGEVRDVQVVQSTRFETLDSAAVEALRHWKSMPGEEWTATVPITFQP
jgi:TonB family protein